MESNGTVWWSPNGGQRFLCLFQTLDDLRKIIPVISQWGDLEVIISVIILAISSVPEDQFEAKWPNKQVLNEIENDLVHWVCCTESGALRPSELLFSVVGER